VAAFKTRAWWGRLPADQDAQPSRMQNQGLDPAGVQAHNAFVFKDRNSPLVGMLLRQVTDRRPEESAVTSPRCRRLPFEDRVYDSSSDPWVGVPLAHESIVTRAVEWGNSLWGTLTTHRVSSSPRRRPGWFRRGTAPAKADTGALRACSALTPLRRYTNVGIMDGDGYASVPEAAAMGGELEAGFALLGPRQ